MAARSWGGRNRPGPSRSEGAGEVRGDAAGRVRHGDIRVYDCHRRRAIRLECRGHAEAELSLAVLHWEVARGRHAFLVRGFRMMVARIDALGRGADHDVHLALVPESGFFSGNGKCV